MIAKCVMPVAYYEVCVLCDNKDLLFRIWPTREEVKQQTIDQVVEAIGKSK